MLGLSRNSSNRIIPFGRLPLTSHIPSLDQAKVGTATAPEITPIRSRTPSHRVLAVPIFALLTASSRHGQESPAVGLSRNSSDRLIPSSRAVSVNERFTAPRSGEFPSPATIPPGMVGLLPLTSGIPSLDQAKVGTATAHRKQLRYEAARPTLACSLSPFLRCSPPHRRKDAITNG